MEQIVIKKIPKKILIIKPSSFGDIIHSLPFLQVIRENFPYAEVHWVIAKGFEELLENHPMVNKLWIINKDRWKDFRKIKTTVKEISELFRELKYESYDIAIDLQGLFRSGMLANATHAPVRVGFREAKEGSTLFYTHRVKGGRDIHAVDRYLKIASALGCEIHGVWFPMPLIKESDRTKELKRTFGKYAIIVPGARKPANRWPATKFGELASMLPIKTVVIGSKDDTSLAEDVVKASGGKAVSIAGQTDIKELISIIRGCSFMVSNDTGPMHIAAAYVIPVVAIFGPANPVRTGPYGDKHVIVKSDIACAPCYKKKCRDIRCMNEITVEQVYKAVKTVMSDE